MGKSITVFFCTILFFFLLFFFFFLEVCLASEKSHLMLLAYALALPLVHPVHHLVVPLFADLPSHLLLR